MTNILAESRSNSRNKIRELLNEGKKLELYRRKVISCSSTCASQQVGAVQRIDKSSISNDPKENTTKPRRRSVLVHQINLTRDQWPAGSVIKLNSSVELSRRYDKTSIAQVRNLSNERGASRQAETPILRRHSVWSRFKGPGVKKKLKSKVLRISAKREGLQTAKLKNNRKYGLWGCNSSNQYVRTEIN